MTIKTLLIVGAALASMSSFALAGEPIALCTGSSTGVYYDAGEFIKKAAGRTLDITNVETFGSGENISRLLEVQKDDDDSCDAIIVQPDVMVYTVRQAPTTARMVTQIGVLHREYLQALCGKGTVDDVGDLESDPKGNNYSIAVGDEGSAGWYTWQNLLAEDDDYAGIRVDKIGSTTALSSIAGGDTTCGLFPSGLNSGTMNEANDMFSDNLDLADVNDSDFNDSVGIDNKPMYEFKEIPGGTYKNLRSFYDTSTISWLARVYISNEKVTDKKVRENLIRAVAKASIDIKQKYGK